MKGKKKVLMMYGCVCFVVLTHDVQGGEGFVGIFHVEPWTAGHASQHFAVVNGLECVRQFVHDVHFAVRSGFHDRLTVGKVQLAIACIHP